MAITPPEQAHSYNAEDLRRIQLKQLHDKIANQKPEVKERAVRILARHIRSQKEMDVLKIELQRGFSIASGDALAALKVDAMVLEASGDPLLDAESGWIQKPSASAPQNPKPWDADKQAGTTEPQVPLNAAGHLEDEKPSVSLPGTPASSPKRETSAQPPRQNKSRAKA